MTHDRPGASSDDRLWCDHCRLSVEPSVVDDRRTCPACGADLGPASD